MFVWCRYCRSQIRSRELRAHLTRCGRRRNTQRRATYAARCRERARDAESA